MTKTAAPTRPTLRHDAAALGLFLILAVAWTWPLAANLWQRIPHDPGDPLLNAWILWWNAHTVPFTPEWWNPPIFFPMRGALALSEHLAGIAVVTTPLQWAGVPPLAAYNVALILSFALSGFFAFLLGRHLTGSTLAGLCAGLAFGFAPYRASQLSHLQVLTSQWMPLALLAMHQYVAGGRGGWLVVFACAWLTQALSNGYYLLFLPLLLVPWLAWFVDWRAAPRRGLALAATWIGSSLLLVPALLHYVRVHHALGLTRTLDDMQRFSAKPGSFLNPGRLLAFWPSYPAATQEEHLFPGVTAVALTVAALLVAAARRHGRAGVSTLVFYASAAIVMALLALGPADSASGVLLQPYTLLAYLPGFSGLRAPARLVMLAVLCLAVSASLAFDRLASARRLVRGAFAALVIAGLAIDGWTRPLPIAAAPRRMILPDVARSTVIELPADEGLVSTAAMYRSITHARPLINGYSGHTPPHYEVLSMATRRGDPSALLEVARGRPLVIAIHESHDAGGRFRRLVEGLPGVQPHGSSSGAALYVLPAGPQARSAPNGDAMPVVIKELPREHALIDLGRSRSIRTIGFALRRHFADLGERMAIETSDDGLAWTTAWEDWTGGPALAASLEDPREVPVRITLPDVRARYLRIHPAPPWLARELRVYAPR